MTNDVESTINSGEHPPRDDLGMAQKSVTRTALPEAPLPGNQETVLKFIDMAVRGVFFRP